VGVVKSLELIGSGPVGLIRTQKFQFFQKQKTHFRGRHALPFETCLLLMAKQKPVARVCEGGVRSLSLVSADYALRLMRPMFLT